MRLIVIMKYNAYAKLNILLNVHGKYFNDYHSIESIMLPVNLYDELDIEIISGSSDIIIECSDKQIPQDENNILYKCAKLFQNKFKIRDGIKIYLHKNIPTQSGLGGESADAASLMHFYNDTYKLDLSFDSIFYLGRLLSWDVPICYLQKCIYINDKTNVCEVIVPQPPLYFLLIKPDFGISTKKAFEKLDHINYANADPKPLLDAFQQSPQKVGKYVYNCFIKTDIRLIDEYNLLAQISKEIGFDGFSMSGTGSCFFGITTDKTILTNGYNFFYNKYPFVKSTNLMLL